MTPLEKKVVAAMRVGEVTSKSALLERVWQGSDEPAMKILDVVVCRLRKHGYDISTVWGRGWVLNSERVKT